MIFLENGTLLVEIFSLLAQLSAKFPLIGASFNFFLPPSAENFGNVSRTFSTMVKTKLCLHREKRRVETIQWVESFNGSLLLSIVRTHQSISNLLSEKCYFRKIRGEGKGEEIFFLMASRFQDVTS